MESSLTPCRLLGSLRGNTRSRSDGGDCTDGEGMEIFRRVSVSSFRFSRKGESGDSRYKVNVAEESKSSQKAQNHETKRKCRWDRRMASDCRMLDMQFGEEKDGKTK